MEPIIIEGCRIEIVDRGNGPQLSIVCVDGQSACPTKLKHHPEFIRRQQLVKDLRKK